jgi:hypothetical protein
VGKEQVSVFDLKDIIAIAAASPAVTAKLTSLGLTPQLEERYRVALVSGQATRIAKQHTTTLTASPAIDQNIAFITAHEADVYALFDTIDIPHH